MQVASGCGLDGKGGFIGFYFQHFLARHHFGAIGDQPFDEGDIFDTVTQFRNNEGFCHQ